MLYFSWSLLKQTGKNKTKQKEVLLRNYFHSVTFKRHIPLLHVRAAVSVWKEVAIPSQHYPPPPPLLTLLFNGILFQSLCPPPPPSLSLPPTPPPPLPAAAALTCAVFWSGVAPLNSEQQRRGCVSPVALCLTDRRGADEHQDHLAEPADCQSSLFWRPMFFQFAKTGSARLKEKRLRRHQRPFSGCFVGCHASPSSCFHWDLRRVARKAWRRLHVSCLVFKVSL